MRSFLLVLLSSCAVSPQLSKWPVAQLVSSLHKYYHSCCVFFLYQDLDLAVETVQIQHEMSALGIPTAAYPMPHNGFNLRSLVCLHGRPLGVVLSTSETAKRRLHQLFSSGSTKICYSRWLLLSPDMINETLMVPFDCEVMVAQLSDQAVYLSEVYRVGNSSPLRWVPWGQWNSAHGLVGPKKSLYARRSDLEGFTLTAAVIHDPPNEVLEVLADGTLRSRGVYASIWAEVERRINCTTLQVATAGNSWGSMDSSGQWTGMVGMLHRGQVNLVFSSLIMTSARAAVIDYTLPVSRIIASVYVQDPDDKSNHEGQWTGFTSPFSPSLWLSTGVAFVLLSMALKFLRQFSSNESTPVSVVESLFCMWQDVCAQGFDVRPVTWSCRLLLWTASVMAFTLLAGYSATLVASLAVRRPSLPFTSLEGLLEYGSYRLGVVSHAGLYSIFQNAGGEVGVPTLKNASNAIYQRVFRVLLEPEATAGSLPLGYRQGLQKVCQEDRYAFMDIAANAESVQKQLPCRIVALPDASFSQHGAMALAPRSPYRGLINYHLLRLHRLGVIEHLLQRDIQQTSSISDNSVLLGVNMQGVAAVLSLLAVGILVATTILLAEIIYNNMLKKSTRYLPR